MANFKLVAIDLDGTLLTDDKRITSESRKWLRYAVDRGVTVMFSTGRGIQSAESYWKELELESPMVMLNGAEIWEGPGRLRKRTFLPRETVRRLHGIAVAKAESFWGYSVESATNARGWTEDMFDRNWMKFGFHSLEAPVLEEIRAELESWGTLEMTSSSPTGLEISVKGITKESGVREVCGMLGIAMSEVMAIGDAENDLRMLRAAGLGVAMGNAENRIKAQAGAVTTSNNENGVALAIQKYVFGLGA